MKNKKFKIFCYNILIISTLLTRGLSNTEQDVQRPEKTDFSTSDVNRIQTLQPVVGPRPISRGIIKPFVPKLVEDQVERRFTGGSLVESTDSIRGISSGSSIGTGGVLRGAVISPHNIEFFDAPIQRPKFTPQMIEFNAGQLPLTLRFRSASSRINVQQVHTGGDGGEERTHSEDKPYLIFHESTRPVIQEVREVITPYRRVIQQIQPVQEEIHTYVARGRVGGGVGGVVTGFDDGSDGVVGESGVGIEGSTGISQGFGVQKPNTGFDGRGTGERKVISVTNIKQTGERKDGTVIAVGSDGAKDGSAAGNGAIVKDDNVGFGVPKSGIADRRPSTGSATGDRIALYGNKTLFDPKSTGEHSYSNDSGTKTAKLRDSRNSDEITTIESSKRVRFERTVENERHRGIRTSFDSDIALLLDMNHLNEMLQSILI